MGYGATKGAAFLASAPLGAGVGGEIGAVGGPLGIAVGGAVGGLVSGSAAAWATDQLLRKLGQYDATIQSFSEAADAHPYYDAAGNLVAFGAGLPRAGMQVAGKVIAGRAGEAGVKTASQWIAEEPVAARAAGRTMTFDRAALARRSLAPGNLRQAVADAYGAAGGGVRSSVGNLAEEARRLALERATAGEIAKVIGYRVGGQATGMVAVDTALKEGAHALGLSDKGQTLPGVVQAAILGAFLSGHGMTFPDTPTDAMAEILTRVHLRQKAGVGLDDALGRENLPPGLDENQAAALARPLTPREMILLGAYEDQVQALVQQGKIKLPQTAQEQAEFVRGATGREVEQHGRLQAATVEIRPPAADGPVSGPPTAPSPDPSSFPSPGAWGDVNPTDIGKIVEDRRGRRGIIYQVGKGAVAARGADGQAIGIERGNARIVSAPEMPDGEMKDDFLAAWDAAADLDSYFAKYYNPAKFDALRKGLTKLGIGLDTEADEFLTRMGIGACFDFSGPTPTVRIKRGASKREVFHELWHVETYRRMLRMCDGDHEKARAMYDALGKPQREIEVYQSWRRRRALWDRLSEEEQNAEIANYKAYLKMLTP